MGVHIYLQLTQPCIHFQLTYLFHMDSVHMVGHCKNLVWQGSVQIPSPLTGGEVFLQVWFQENLFVTKFTRLAYANCGLDPRIQNLNTQLIVRRMLVAWIQGFKT